MLTLQAAYGLKDNKLIVFSDRNNDIEMFQIADSVVRYIHQDWTQLTLLKLV
ncbi:hypothetical protein [Calothrix sp. NIES-2098]|uniref:hypothetical protein n=1 Tax=Calothrix sp. NIES-2098 TaxID=1954171 RepID=UPI0040401FE6